MYIIDSGTATADQQADVYTISPSEAVIFWNNLTEKTYITGVSGDLGQNYFIS